jgi:hypothetical protein
MIVYVFWGREYCTGFLFIFAIVSNNCTYLFLLVICFCGQNGGVKNVFLPKEILSKKMKYREKNSNHTLI